MTKKLSHRSAKYAENSQDTSATPVVLDRHDKDDALEIALIMQDNAPMWRLFGNAFVPPESGDPKRHDMYRNFGRKVLAQETNLPIKLRSTVEPIYAATWVDEKTGQGMEKNHVLAVDVGNFDVKSKKGAFVEFFPIDKRPENMSAGHERMFDLAANALKHDKRSGDFDLAFDYSSRYQLVEQLVENKGNIVGLDEWHKHPNVIAKRNAGKLSFDVPA